MPRQRRFRADPVRKNKGHKTTGLGRTAHAGHTTTCKQKSSVCREGQTQAAVGEGGQPGLGERGGFPRVRVQALTAFAEEVEVPGQASKIQGEVFCL